MSNYDHLFKVLLIGDAGVGKSSMLLRFTDDSFDENLGSTIGVDFKVKVVTAGEKKVKLTLWDTAGQERFRTLTSSYYRGGQGVILVYDVTRPETFENLHQWLEEIETYTPGRGSEIVKLLVGNKIDRKRAVSRESAESWARQKGMLFLETSAKDNLGVDAAFEEVVQKIIDNPVLLASTTPGQKKRLDLNTNAPPPSSCC